jgi:hypothetical protein
MDRKKGKLLSYSYEVLIVLLVWLGFGLAGDVILPSEATARDIEFSSNGTSSPMNLTGKADELVLLDLNEAALPQYKGQNLQRLSLSSQFYVESLPRRGKLYQAYRPQYCEDEYPASCRSCCRQQFKTLEDGFTTCCAPNSDAGARLYFIGDEIVSVPTKVLIRESGYLWYRPVPGENGDEYTKFNVSAEFWTKDTPPISNVTAGDSGCAADRAICAANNRSKHCTTCSPRSPLYTVNIRILDILRYPQVGFGGHMIAFDGGDDYMMSTFSKMPQYEFTLQFWFQQNKRRQGQSLLTWWTEARGREWEIADSSNLHFYHMNNRSQYSGVGVNDGLWHHLAFVWRLVCAPEVRFPGGTYCESNAMCDIDKVCLHVEITIFVDAVAKSTVTLPAFLPSREGQLVWGQRMLKPFTTSEAKLKETLYKELKDAGLKQTSGIPEPYTDNQLQLIYNRLRSTRYNSTQLFGDSLSKEAFIGPLTESQPFRDPSKKYCALVTGGGFDPWSALSANIDEVRLYGYARKGDDIALDINDVINSDGRYTFSKVDANRSLMLYYNFDLTGTNYAHQSRDDLSKWPLKVEDLSPFDGFNRPSTALLGGEVFKYAPLQVPSTAPLRGSRTIQIVVPDNRDPIPIDLIDAVRYPDPSKIIYTRVDVPPKYGDLTVGADDCDVVRTVDLGAKKIVDMPLPFCKGSVVGIQFRGTSGDYTGNCSVNDRFTATDGAGRGFEAFVKEVDATGAIQSFNITAYGQGYDWTLASITDVVTDKATCQCGGRPGNVTGNMRACMFALISPGKANTSGLDFTGLDVDLGVNGLPVTYRVTCPRGQCPATKPRPCTYACHRTVGWSTDVLATEDRVKQMVGPYSEYRYVYIHACMHMNVHARGKIYTLT